MLATVGTAVTTTAVLPGGGDNVLIYNATSAPVACEFDAVSTSATASSPHVVPPGGRMLVTLGSINLFASAVLLSAGSGTVFFMRGDGSTY